MRRGRHSKPTITIESVQSALKLLQFNTDSSSVVQPLTQLVLVDKFLADSARPSADNLREWALCAFIKEIILREYDALLHEFEINQYIANRNDAESYLTLIFQQPSDILKGWCLLTYRYAKPEYGFSMEEIGRLTSTHPRTLRRYTRAATFALRDLLIEREWETRRLQNKISLKAEIPVNVQQLIGRQAETAFLLNALSDTVGVPVFVTGVSGIGKTAFVASVAQQLIEDDKVDYMVWVKSPRSLGQVINQIWNTVAPHASVGEWYEYLFDNRLFVVIDDATQASSDDGWQHFCNHMRTQRLICTQNSQLKVSETALTIQLNELSSTEAQALIMSLVAISHEEAFDYTQLVSEIGGNPRHLEAVARGLKHANIGDNLLQVVSDKALLAHTLERDFNQLTEQQQYVWCKVAIPQHGIASMLLDSSDVTALKEQGIVRQNLTQLVLNSPLHTQYIIQRYQDDALFRRDVIASLRREIRSNFTSENHEAVFHHNQLILSVVSCSWLGLTPLLLYELAPHIITEKMTTGQLRIWRSCIEHIVDFTNIANEQNDMYLTYIEVARRMRDPSTPEFTANFVTHCGKQGAFTDLIQAQYELAVFYHAMGAFEDALNIYNDLHQLLPNYPNEDIEQMLQIQHARIAIAQNVPVKALELLKDCNQRRVEVQILKCEALYQQGMYQRCLNLVQHSLKQSNLSVRLQSTLHTIAGRIYQAWHDTENAIIHFNEALILSEYAGDVLDMCRAHTNLVSAQLMLHKHISALELTQATEELKYVRQQQKVAGDYVGLEATQRTLKFIESI